MTINEKALKATLDAIEDVLSQHNKEITTEELAKAAIEAYEAALKEQE